MNTAFGHQGWFSSKINVHRSKDSVTSYRRSIIAFQRSGIRSVGAGMFGLGKPKH